MSGRSERLWRGFAVAAAFLYLVALFAPWGSSCYRHKGWLSMLEATVTSACGSWASQIGIVSLVLCHLILVLALLGPRRSALSLEPLRTVLAFSLLVVTFVNVLIHLLDVFDPPLPGVYRSVGHLGIGAWVALGSSLALLLAVRALDVGGLSGLRDGLPAWARIDRLENPEEKSDEQSGDPDAPGHDLWTGVLILALVVYLFSLFTRWWSSSGFVVVGLVGLGGFCALVAVATLVVAFMARSDRRRELASARSGLALSLACLTVLNLLQFKHDASGSLDPFSDRTPSRPEYGAYIALGSLAVILFSALVLNAGGWMAFTGRLSIWARLDRLGASPGEGEEST